MSEKTYIDLGQVTAYAYAKAHGYTGTEEEFAIEQAHFAQNAQQVAEDRVVVRADRVHVDEVVEAFTETTAPEAVQSVIAEGNTQVDRVQDESDTQIANVQAEGATQVRNVQAEGTTQLQAVEDKGEEVLESIPENYEEKMDEVNDYLTNVIKVSDVQPESEANKLWIKDQVGQEYTVPTYEEFESLSNDVSNALSAIDQLDTQADTQDLLSNMDAGMVNYQYDTYVHIDPVPSASDSTKLGIERNKQIVTLNGGGLSGDPIVVRLTGNISRTILTKTVKSWQSTFQLKDGHYYEAKIKYLSGTQTVMRPSISIYKVGTASTAGALVYTDDYNYTRAVIGDDGYYNICLYVTAGYAYENAKYLVTLEDLTDQKHIDFDYFDEKINQIHHLINYGYGSYKETLYQDTSDGNAGTAVGVERYGTDIKLNYAGSSYPKRVRISGIINRTSSNTTYKNWVGNLQLTEGKEYRCKIVKKSGTGTFSGNPYIPSLVVYPSHGASTIATSVYSDEASKEYSFVAPAGAVSFAIYIDSAAVLTDFACSVYLYEAEDEGGEVNDYYLTELADTVEKSRNEFTSPALVFMWATDIHRLSSNAGGVQNFGNMIANMKAFSKKVPCDFILCTGDLTDGDQAKDTTLSRSYDCMTDFRSIGIPFVWAHGNHDNNPYISSGSLVLSLPECYKAYFESAEGVYNVSENGTEYYIDFDRLNTRLISLNANNSSAYIKYAYGQSTATWLASALDTDKNVIITLHQSPITSQVYDNTSTTGAANIRSAITTFVNGGGNVIMLSGHSHNDIAFVSPYLSVMQDCQRFSDLAEDVTDQAHGMSGFIDVVRKCARVQNTATEDLWSVGVYKPDTNELSLIRFGAGKDRYFHVTPIAPTTLTSKLSGTLTWNSSDDAVATVADGVVTGVATGRCAILAHDESDNYECWIVEVA